MHVVNVFFCSDCGVFIASFVEFLLHGLEIPKEMNIKEMRNQYVVSLYSYAKWKQSNLCDSDFECHGRLKPNDKGKFKVIWF